MSSPSTLEKIKAKRLQAEQTAKELRDAEIEAAFREAPITDDAYLSVCRILSKQRQRTQQVRHRLGRKRYSIEVQERKLAQSRAEHKQLGEQLDKYEKQQAKLEEDARQRREDIYQTLEA